MGSVAATDTRVTLELAKSYAQISGSEQDALISLLIVASAQVADEYLNNPFTDDNTDTGTDVPIPEAISLGRLVFIKHELERRPAGVNFAKAGDWAVRYTTGEQTISADVERHWKYWRLIPRDDADASTLQSPLFVGA